MNLDLKNLETLFYHRDTLEVGIEIAKGLTLNLEELSFIQDLSALSFYLFMDKINNSYYCCEMCDAHKPYAIYKFKQSTVIERIRYIYERIYWPDMHSLYFKNNQNIPKAIHIFNVLRHLHLNKFHIIPNHLYKIKNLKSIKLTESFFEYTIPDNFEQLYQLEELHFTDSKARHFAANFCKIPNLEQLIITNTQIGHLPKEFGQFGQLQQANLSKNQLQSLPKSFGSLKNLIHLDLSNNQLKQLPTNFAKLKQLRKLDISNNNFTTFPVEICQLTNLEELSIAGNQLKELPNCLTNLQQLKIINLNDNYFDKLPEILLQVPHLQTIKCKRNPLIANLQSAYPDNIIPKLFLEKGYKIIPYIRKYLKTINAA